MGIKDFIDRISVQLLILFTAFTLSSVSIAAITVDTDRETIVMGESLRLTIAGDASSRLDYIDLAALQFDWEILSSSSSTDPQFIDGNKVFIRTLTLDLLPLRDGVLSIPSLSLEGSRTAPIMINVKPQTVSAGGDDSVRFSVEIDKRDVYIQEQMILTVTIEQAINLDDAEVTQLELNGAIVEELTRRNFQRQINGRLWRVTQLRYAIFPQQRGTLEIPSLLLTAREALPGRSLVGARLGKRFRLSEDAIDVNVKPVPADFPGDVWLPAASLELAQSWSTPPESMEIGDSIIRTVRLDAEGLLISQLPSISSQITGEKIEGFKIASESFQQDEKEIADGFQGNKIRRAVLIADAPGEWLFPTIEVPWWNTKTNKLEYATLPAKPFSISEPPHVSQQAKTSRPFFNWESALSELKGILSSEPTTPPQSDNGLNGKALQCFANGRADIDIGSVADDSTFWRFIRNVVVQDSIERSNRTAEIKSEPQEVVLSDDAILLGSTWSLNRKTLRLTNKKTEKTQQCEIFYIQSEYSKQLYLIRDRIQLQIDPRLEGNLI